MAVDIGHPATRLRRRPQRFLPVTRVGGRQLRMSAHRRVLGAQIVVVTLLVATICVVQGSLARAGFVALAMPPVVVASWLLLPHLGRLLIRSQVVDELTERVAVQMSLPQPPAGWSVSASSAPAGGGPMGGDVVVAHQNRDRYELLLADVSGSGSHAAARAALLGASASALLGVTHGDSYLPALNEHIVRQDWQDGFATAAYLQVDLRTGEFELQSAGHPAALLRRCDGECDAVGVAASLPLGIVDGLGASEYRCARGRLGIGESLVLFTDGVVESAERDISAGVDALRARIDDSGPQRLAAAIVSESGDDDRCVVVLCRDAADEAMERATRIELA